MKIHNIFYLNFIQKIFINPLIDQVNELAQTVLMNNKEK